MFSDSLVGDLRAVCSLDPALDRSAMPMTEYWETRDPALVRELPGRAALWCTLRPLSVGDFLSVDQSPMIPHKLYFAFRDAVRSIENWSAPGMALQGTKIVRDADGKERRVFDQREIDEIAMRCGIGFIYELGHVAYERAVQGNGWSGSAIYTLPQSSVLGLELIARRLAAQERRIAGTISREQFARDGAMTSSPSSDADTAAPAPNGVGVPADTPPPI